MPASEPMPQWNRRGVIGAGLGLLAAPVIGAGVASAADATVTPHIVRLEIGRAHV